MTNTGELPQDQNTRPVDEFLSASSTGNVLLYPGENPGASYVTDGTLVHGLDAQIVDGKLDVQAEGHPLNEFLADHNAAAIEDRIPVIAYGANLSPASLKQKFQKVGRPDAMIVPTIFGELAGHDVVWSAGPGTNGNFIASLYSGPETASTRATVGVNLLTREQLLVLNATELAYELHTCKVEIPGGTITAYVYGGQDNVYLRDGQPVAVAAVQAEGRTMTAAPTSELIDEILQLDDVKEILKARDSEVQPTTAEDYVAMVKTIKKPKGSDATPRGDLKKAMQAAIAKAGRSNTVVMAGQTESWMNPSVLRTLGEQQSGATSERDIYVLPTSELPIDRWADPEARRKVLHALGTHFHRNIHL